MKHETNLSQACDHADDLISFLYGEASESETREFEKHLHQCASCRGELASFGVVRDSIGTWKQEALGGSSVSNVVVPVRTKSAVAALREFFDLSPLWMKGAIGFAAVLFCVMVGVTLFRAFESKPVVQANKDVVYTPHQVDEMIKKAISEQEAKQSLAGKSGPTKEEEVTPAPKSEGGNKTRNTGRNSQWAQGRRTLSKSEREQLAADLRLLSTDENDNLKLLGDRIN